RADKIETLCAQLADDQASAGKSNFRLGCARDDRSVTITHNDVTQSQRRSSLFVALELSSADNNRVISAKIFFYGGFEPRSRHVEFDRTARQSPPQKKILAEITRLLSA